MPAMRDYEMIGAADCPVCGRTETLIAPDCADGHGGDCPDRTCVRCGTALFVDPAMSTLLRRRVARIA